MTPIIDPKTSVLRFRRDRTFTIVQFTDLHWRDGGGLDELTKSLMELVLDAERPDIVVLTGDVLDGGDCADPANSWRQAVQAIESRGVPWAAVFGNHDDEGSLSRAELMAVQQSCRGCLSEPGPTDLPGVGNFVLLIRGSTTDEPAGTLYMLDSRAYAGNGSADGYAGVSAEQIVWFRAASSVLRQTEIVGLAFFHVPLHEFDDAFNLGLGQGMMLEPVCCPCENAGLFAALRESRHVIGAFAGHDHLNDFDATLEGIRLCYGRVSGFGGYGRDNFQPGARVIRLHEGSREFTTWLRLADGSDVHQSVAKPRGRATRKRGRAQPHGHN